MSITAIDSSVGGHVYVIIAHSKDLKGGVVEVLREMLYVLLKIITLMVVIVLQLLSNIGVLKILPNSVYNIKKSRERIC